MNLTERSSWKSMASAFALSLALGISAFAIGGTTAAAEEAAGIEYLDEHGYPDNAPSDCTDFREAIGDGYTLMSGWYYVPEDTVFDKRVYVDGDVRLIICDNVRFEVNGGINVWQGCSLTIYGQAEDNGLLIADASAGEDETMYDDCDWAVRKDAYSNYGCAGIGGRFTRIADAGRYKDCGRVTICGALVIAIGGSDAAGIGGSMYGNGGEVIVHGGCVEACGHGYAAGIGGSLNTDGGTFTIDGGDVVAKGGSRQMLGGGAGIGGGYKGDAAVVTVLGGSVEAHAGLLAAAIGAGGFRESSKLFYMSNGIVYAYRNLDEHYPGGNAIGDGYLKEDKQLELRFRLTRNVRMFDASTNQLVGTTNDDLCKANRELDAVCLQSA